MNRHSVRSKHKWLCQRCGKRKHLVCGMLNCCRKCCTCPGHDHKKGTER